MVDELGYEKVSLVAHSFGGNAAARFSALYPGRVDKLVLVDAMGPSKAAIEKWEQAGVAKRTRDWLEKRRTARDRAKRFDSIDAAAERLRKGNPGLSADQARYLAGHGVRKDADGYGWKHDPVLGNFMPEDFAIHLSGFWKEIAAPTMIMWGAKSWSPNPATDGSSDYFSNAVNVAFEDAGHWLHHDRLREFVSRVGQFLNDGYLFR